MAWIAGWILVAHSVTPTLISCTILQVGQFFASSLLKPATSGLVGGTSSDTTRTMFALPSVFTAVQLARIVPTSPKPIVRELETSGFCLSLGS